MKKSEALHRNSSTGSEYSTWLNFKRNQSENLNPIILGNEKSQQIAFRKFLQQREVRILKKYFIYSIEFYYII